MSDLIKKPYEISVWEDELVIPANENENGYYKENKIAVIGSNKMTGLNKVYEPVFTKGVNGEKHLSFSLRYKYFDPYVGAEIVNPFAAYLINERKIKLHYDNQWYDFKIREHTESSDGLIWTYSCDDAFVLELSKNGYALEFSTELNNNQGTAEELAEKVLENTDWQLADVQVGKQQIEEPIYKATLNSTTGITIVNVDNSNNIEYLSTPLDIYVFYSYVSNKDGKFVQFILQNDSYTTDSNNNIIATNYRIQETLIFDNNTFKNDNNVTIISIGDIETKYHAYRMAYGQLTTYDPIMERTVDRFKIEGQDREIYRYIDYVYTTSDVVTNYITNGDGFNIYDNGTLQGWSENTKHTDVTTTSNNQTIHVKPTLELTTYPEIDNLTSLAPLDSTSQIEGYLELKFNGVRNGSINGIYNSGIENNASFIDSITCGEEFVLRWRGGKSTSRHGSLSKLTGNEFEVIVTTYDLIDWTDAEGATYSVYEPNINGAILHFSGTGTVLNNEITGGTLVEGANGKLQYVIDGVAQEPSTQYVYKEGNTEYVWDSQTNTYVLKSSKANYLDYYYLKAAAKKSVSQSILSDPTIKLGIFLYTTDASKWYYIQDIELTRYYKDANQNPVTIGNIPVASATKTEYYYLAPKANSFAADVETYTKLDTLANSLLIDKNLIVPLYNENSIKVLSINESNSNCFNILQTIAETFECWIDLSVDREEDGAIKLDENNNPKKYVYLREYAGKDNFAGFKYGINIDTIERTINSDEIVTKLIVDPAQSDYVESGIVTIQEASSNPSGESYILNFDYYFKQNLITNREQCESDILEFNEALKEINTDLKQLQSQKADLENALTKVISQRNIYTELVDTAKKNVADGLEEFKQLTGRSYNDYQQQGVIYSNHIFFPSSDTTVKQSKDYFTRSGDTFTIVSNPSGNPKTNNYYEQEINLVDNDTVATLIGSLYTNSSVINSYSGLLTNKNIEYQQIRQQLYGLEEYNFTTTIIEDIQNGQKHFRLVLSDYVTPFSFVVNDTTYVATVSINNFDINVSTNSITISDIIIPNGYVLKLGEQNIGSSFTISLDESKTIRLVPIEVIPSVQSAIDNKLKDKNVETLKFYKKYSRFIQEGTWNATDYINSELYYLDALQVSNTSAQPQVSYTINVVEISELEGFDGYLFDAGDKTYIEDTEFFGWASINDVLTPAREEVIVSEVEWHLDEPDQNVITIQNYKTQFEDLFQRISAAVQTVQYNEATYAKISSLLDANGNINQDVLVESLQRIAGKQYTLTSDGSVLIDGDCILIRNLTNAANLVKINSEGIRISGNGGNTWSTAINGQGINIGEVFAGFVNTNKIIIGDSENPSFRWDQAGISAYRNDGEYYNLNTYVRYDQYGLYGINDGSSFVANSLQDVIDNAHFAVTWDGFFIRNSYEDGGRVSITSDDDFQVIDGNNIERIKIGSLGIDQNTGDRVYGITINDKNGNSVLSTDNDGDLTISGTIYANAGEIGGMSVDDTRLRMDHIVFEPGTGIYSDWGESSVYPFIISDKDGSATFNNVTVRGSIKTSVFEYEEIQAVGGAFMFRPSTAIKTAVEDNGDLILTVEKPLILRDGAWYKLSNYNSDDTIDADELTTYGLTHIYQLNKTKVNNETEIRLIGGAAILQTINIDDIPGGSIIDMGFEPNTYRPISLIEESSPVALHLYELANDEYVLTTDIEVVSGKTYYKEWYQEGINNYGIGINSSDNYINLPPRAISLFETIVNHTQDPKVSYKYRGILGTLPDERLNNISVNSSIYPYMRGTQGIYTDNMYLGDASQYIAFYEDNNGRKQLRIKANQIMFEIADPEPGQDPWQDIADFDPEGTPGPAGQDAIRVAIESNIGNEFILSQEVATLTCTVYRGAEDVTSQVTKFLWVKNQANGSPDTTWNAAHENYNLPYIEVTPSEINKKAIFGCRVTLPE